VIQKSPSTSDSDATSRPVAYSNLHVANLAQRFRMDVVDLETHKVDMELLARFPSQDLFRESILPLSPQQPAAELAATGFIPNSVFLRNVFGERGTSVP
jgi:hypothetical protein